MKRRAALTLLSLAALFVVAAGLVLLVTYARAASSRAPLAPVGAPTVVSYQGRVTVGGTPYVGTGSFKFAIVNAAGDATYWSSDGTSTGGGEPTASVPLTVEDGLFNVLLGDTSLTNMTQPLEASVFSGNERYLRVWFSDDGATFTRLVPDTRVAAVPYALQAQQAASVPWSGITGAPDFQEEVANVVVVAKSGGDYTSVQAAITDITDARADNPYLVWVAPGVYSETVTMKPYVHLQGAGQEATVITSTIGNDFAPPTRATLILTDAVSLRDLTVGNSGTDAENVAMMATYGATQTLVADVTARAQGGGHANYAVLLNSKFTAVTLQDVTTLAENASVDNLGLVNSDGSAATLRGGSFIGRGGQFSGGIANTGSGATLETQGVTALGQNGSTGNLGLGNGLSAKATLYGGSFIGRGGLGAGGISNEGSDTNLAAQYVTAIGVNATTRNVGLYNGEAAIAGVTESVLIGLEYSVYHADGTVFVSNSRLVGGAVFGTPSCTAVSRGGTFNASGCP